MTDDSSTTPRPSDGYDPIAVHHVQRRTIRTLSVAQVFSGLATAGAIPAGSLLAATIVDSDAVAGLAQTAGVVGAAALALPLARLALSHGRRPALAAGFAIGALGTAVVVVSGATGSLVGVLLGCFLVGSASAAGLQARYAATDLATTQHRARALSWVVWAGTVGAVLGPNLLAASGRLGQALGLPRLTGPYVVAGVCLAIAVLALLAFLRPDPYVVSLAVRHGDGQRPPRPRLRDGLAHLRGRARAILGIATIAAGHLVMVAVMVMTPVHMAHVDVTLELIGLVISVHVAGMFALSPVVGWAVDRFGRLPVAGAGVVLLAVAAVLAAVARPDDVVLLGVGLFLLGLGWSCTLISGSALVTDETEPGERPAVQGLSDLAMNAAGALGGIIAGLIVAFASYSVLAIAMLLPLAGLAAMMSVPACRSHSNNRSV